MRFRPLLLISILLVATGAPAQDKATKPILVSERARAIHRSAPVIDGHNDLPWAMRQIKGRFDATDISQHQPSLHTDIPRLKKGGVGAQFWSVYVPVSTQRDGKALATTLEQIDLVHEMIRRYPETFQLALGTDDIQRIRGEGKIASLIGVEGGHSIENSLNVLRQLYARGARYMTLTHSKTLDWADSCTDEAKHGGLSKFGEQVVREMNRLGMLVDISHVSPDCMRDTLRVTQAPVIFSHSSARAVADHPRNVPDDVLRLTRDNGGVVMINFFNSFVHPDDAQRSVERMELQTRLRQEFTEKPDRIASALKQWDLQHPAAANCSVHHVLEHIDHVVKVAGVAHVGLGSDYDGISATPLQLRDVSTYPVLTQGLLDRGYSESDIRKILGENLMRVFKKVEQAAQR